MEKSSRVWFDYVYEVSSGWLPFGIFSGEPERNDLIKATCNRLTDDEITRLEEITLRCHKSLPSAKDFIEEKRRIYPLLKRDLRDVLPYVETFVTFGSTRGDIDLGIINPDPISDEQLDLSMTKDLVRKYPLVDWNGVWFFKSKNGYELTQRIIRSRELVYIELNDYPLPIEEKECVRRTVLSAMVLHGSEDRILEMKREFFMYLIFPRFSRN